MTTPAQTERFLSLVLANHWNATLLERIPALALPDWWLTAGCLAQSVWNGLYGRPSAQGILDYDVIYYDPDTSWRAEDRVVKRATAAFGDLPVTVQVRNQARVPLWYQQKFGIPFPPVSRASDGIDRFPCSSTAVGIRRTTPTHGSGILDIHAPFGLDALLDGRLTPNPALPIAKVYDQKVARWQNIWPELDATPWPESPDCALNLCLPQSTAA
jgi:hypothetical protein